MPGGARSLDELDAPVLDTASGQRIGEARDDAGDAAVPASCGCAAVPCVCAAAPAAAAPAAAAPAAAAPAAAAPAVVAPAAEPAAAPRDDVGATGGYSASGSPGGHAAAAAPPLGEATAAAQMVVAEGPVEGDEYADGDFDDAAA